MLSLEHLWRAWEESQCFWLINNHPQLCWQMIKTNCLLLKGGWRCVLTQNRKGRRKSPAGLVGPWLVWWWLNKSDAVCLLAGVLMKTITAWVVSQGGEWRKLVSKGSSVVVLEKPNWAFAGITTSPCLHRGPSQLAPADCVYVCAYVCGWVDVWVRVGVYVRMRWSFIGS